MRLTLSGRRDSFFWCVLFTLLATFAVWQCFHLSGYRWDWDEGVYALTARSVAEGNRLYGDIFSMAPPLFIASLQGVFQLAGDTVPVGRAAIVLYSTLGLLGAGLLAREWGGRLAGLVTVVILAVAPHFYVLSRAIIADIPSLSLSCLALWMAVRYERTGRWNWLVASGIVLAWGMLVKLTAGLAAPVILALVLLRDMESVRDGDWGTALWRTGRSAVVLGSSVLVPLAAVLALYPAREMLDQVVVLLWAQQETFVPDWEANAEMIVRYLVLDNFNIALNRGLTLLGLVGGIGLAFRSLKDSLVWALWALIVLAILVSYAPLWPHLLSPILFPLAVGAGMAAGELYRLLFRAGQQGWSMGQISLALLLAVAFLVYAYDLPRIIAEDGKRGRAPGNSAFEDVLSFVGQYTLPEDYVITDEPLLAFYADRRVPPDLIDCSVVRTASGYLTTEDLIRATDIYSPSAVILGRDSRFSIYLPGYVDWLAGRYVVGWTEDGGGVVFLENER